MEELILMFSRRPSIVSVCKYVSDISRVAQGTLALEDSMTLFFFIINW
jgi:hypothetical protein